MRNRKVNIKKNRRIRNIESKIKEREINGIKKSECRKMGNPIVTPSISVALTTPMNRIIVYCLYEVTVQGFTRVKARSSYWRILCVILASKLRDTKLYNHLTN